MLFRKLRTYYYIRQVLKDMESWMNLEDIESDRYKNKSWEDPDGWRGVSYSDEVNKFYFNDYPEKSFTRNLDVLIGMEDSGK